MFKKKKLSDISKLGDRYESHSFKFIAVTTNRLLHGFFHFKKRKGEILAGSATFFSILSFCPIILLFISITGSLMGDVHGAKDYVLEVINSNFPHLAPWILKSIQNIVENQLSGASTNYFNIFLLLYACLGVVTSIMFGLNEISHVESKGGFILEDFKSMVTGVVFSMFIVCLLVISNKKLFFALIPMEAGMAKNSFQVLFKFNFLPAVTSLGFFTAFYMYSTEIKVKVYDALLGAISFVSCFVLGKSFHWIYMNVAKDALKATYGNFETLIIAILWMYFLMCAFFFGASVAHSHDKKIYKPLSLQKSSDDITDIMGTDFDEPPDIGSRSA
jgi:membrane protein